METSAISPVRLAVRLGIYFAILFALVIAAGSGPDHLPVAGHDFDLTDRVDELIDNINEAGSSAGSPRTFIILAPRLPLASPPARSRATREPVVMDAASSDRAGGRAGWGEAPPSFPDPQIRIGAESAPRFFYRPLPPGRRHHAPSATELPRHPRVKCVSG